MFAKMYALKCAARSDLRVLFVPLHHFDLKADLETALRDHVLKAGFLAESPLDRTSGVERLLIIFDGLDELGMLGKLAEEVARKFIHEVHRTLAQQNAAALRVQAILTGRELTVQAHALEFRREGEILHLVAYYEPGTPKQRREHGFRDPKNLLQNDQRNVWWKKYGALTGKDYTGLPEGLKRDDLDEVTSQPLLNYLVALSYEGGKINFSQEVSLNTIYHDLLDRIYERGWEDNRNPAVGKLDAGEFARVLEEIALAVWHGKGRTTTVKKIEEHCQAGGLTRLLDVFQEGAKSGITRLLTAFYFRESGTEGEDRAFEFTHKSFGEYLTARRLARMTRRIDQELARKKGSYDEGWDERDALKHLVDLCGPTPIDDYLLRFIRLEFALAERDEAKNWQESYVALTNAMLQAGMPMELLPERRSFLHEMKQARNAKTALMLLLNAAARVTKQISSIRWPNPSSAGELFRELVEPDGPRLTRTDLSLLDVSGCWLQGMSGHATFHASSLAGANLAAGMFIICDFSEAKMSKIHAAFTSFVYCNFDGADLSQANFDQTRWTKSILKKALLRGVRCEDGDFKDAELRAAEFNNAKLTRCDFRGANLTGASFAGARLKNCDFTGAKITNINLKGCKRTDVKGLIRRRRTK